MVVGKSLKERVGTVLDSPLSSFVALSEDIYRGLVLGSSFGALGWMMVNPVFGLTTGSAIAFMEYFTSPSQSAWRSFIKKRTPAKANLRTPNFSLPLATASAAVTGFLAYKTYSHPNIASLLQIASWPEDKAVLLKLFGTSIPLLLYAGNFAYRVGASIPKDFLSFHFKEPKLAKEFFMVSLQSDTTKKIASLEHLSNQGLAIYLSGLVKEKRKEGNNLEALSLVLNHFYKHNSLSATLLSPLHSRNTIIIDDVLLKKPSIELFMTSLLSNQEQALTASYAQHAINQAMKEHDVASLSLLARYQSENNSSEADGTWQALARLCVSNNSLEEKILGEGHSGGASQLLFSGAKDDPLRTTMVVTTGDKKTLEGKFNLGSAVYEQSESLLFSTPRMISLQDVGAQYKLFREQLWGVPLDEFSLANQSDILVPLYEKIILGIKELQEQYAQQTALSIPQTNWEEKFLSKENIFYEAKQIEQSLDWLVGNTSSLSAQPIQHPIVDPYVRNIGVREHKDGTFIIPYWDIEPKTRAPRMYDYATLLLTAKPSLSDDIFSLIREYALHQYEKETSFSPDSALKAYAGATILRTVSLVKAWSNKQKQPLLFAQRNQLVHSSLDELSYVLNCGDTPTVNFAEQNSVLLKKLVGHLDVLGHRFSYSSLKA